MADLESRVAVLESDVKDLKSKTHEHSVAIGGIQRTCAGHEPLLGMIKETMAGMAKDLRERMDKMDQALEDLKAVPANRYEKLVIAAGTAVVSGLVGAGLALLFGGK